MFTVGHEKRAYVLQGPLNPFHVDAKIEHRTILVHGVSCLFMLFLCRPPPDCTHEFMLV